MTEPVIANTVTANTTDGNTVYTINNTLVVSAPAHSRVVGAENSDLTFPLSAEVAEKFLDDDGYITVVVPIDQDMYLEAYASGLSGMMGDNQFDLVHDLAFTSGMPEDCYIDIIGVTENAGGFILSYRTFAADFINEALGK